MGRRLKTYFLLGQVFEKLYGEDYNEDRQFCSLTSLIKIDFPAFLAFLEKYKLRRLLNIDENQDMKTRKEIWKMMDIDGDGVMSLFEFKQWTKKVMEVSCLHFIFLSFRNSEGALREL